MPRYFFQIQTFVRVADRQGMVLPNQAAARTEAIRASGEMMRDGAESFWSTRPWSVTVTDESGLILLRLEMDDRAALSPMASE